MTSLPTFSGFPPKAFKFLEDLEKNNNREWFQAHKQEYMDSIVAPAQSFIVTLGKRLQTLSPGMRYDTRTNGQGSMGRIYRDLRFTKDKRPYNTHVWFVFWEGPGKKMECPGFGIGFDREGWGMYGGHHGFAKPMLLAYREAVVDDALGRELEEAITPLQRGGRYEIGEMKYTRVPAGYDPDHPRAHWLRYNGLWAHSRFQETEVIGKPAFVERCFDVGRELAPLHRWLVKVDQRSRPWR